MYAAQSDPTEMSQADYLAFTGERPAKFEYKEGYVYVMTGGSLWHNVITVNTSTHLNILLDESDCLVSSPDTRIHIASKNAYRYPDVSVVCDDPVYIEERTDTIVNPVLLVEVLSPSTALIDYSEKLAEYTTIDSLVAYLLVAQNEARIDSYIRQGSGQWLYQSVTGLQSEIRIPSLHITMALGRIYRKVDLANDQG